ncbi:unnamed protein product [Natator depressus]
MDKPALAAAPAVIRSPALGLVRSLGSRAFSLAGTRELRFGRGRGQPVVHGAPCGGCQGEAAAASRVANDPARPGAARFSLLGRGTSSFHTPPPRPASAEPHLPGGPLWKEGLGGFSHLAARQYLILNTAERNY